MQTAWIWSFARRPRAAPVSVALATSRPARWTSSDRIPASWAMLGSRGERRATAWVPETRRSPRLQPCVTAVMAFTNDTVRTRSLVGLPGLTAAGAWTAVGMRPPPAVGTQPMKGRYAVGRDAPPVYVPVKTTSSVVVTPGLTGLPSRPLKLISIARWVSRASTPPTMLPSGHFMRHDLWGNRASASPRGTATHGPATGMQTWRPRHSSAARADGAASTVSAATKATSPGAALTAAS